MEANQIKIIDHRKEKYLEWNGPNIIQKILNASDPKYLRGIEKILLFDTDYKKKMAIGRWIPKKYGYMSDIEIMFDVLDKYPKNMLTNEITVAFELSDVLFHEIYHHRRSLINLKKHKKDKDEDQADIWGRKRAVEVMNKIYPKDKLRDFKKHYLKFQKSP